MAMAKKQTGIEKRDIIKFVSSQLFFTEDLMIEILIRLPMKALFRCKCVCREWRSLISDPAFVTRFITRSKSLAPLVTGIFIGISKVGNCLADMCLYDFGSKIDLNDTPLDTSLNFLQRSTVIVASHCGYLLCIEKTNKYVLQCQRFRYILCNPLTKQWVDLPLSRYKHQVCHTVLFCYSKEECNGQQVEFKVVSFRDVCDNELKMETYSSEMGKWKFSRISNCGDMVLHRNIMYNGSVYFWEGQPYVYNLTRNSGHFFTLPPSSSSHPDMWGRVMGVSSGSLYYACSDWTSFRVWALVNETEWSLMHVVDYATISYKFPRQMRGSQCGFFPIAFHPLNHELIFVKLWSNPAVSFGTSNNFILYHTSERKIDHVKYYRPNIFLPSISYCLPAWIPFLKGTSKENVRKRRKLSR